MAQNFSGLIYSAKCDILIKSDTTINWIHVLTARRFFNMTRNKIQAALLCLCVVLLYCVSARIGQHNEFLNAEAVDNTASDEPQDGWVMPTPEPTPTPTPTPYVDPDLPDITITDWTYKLIDNTHVLANTFIPPEVVETEDGQYIDSRVKEPLESMLAGARDAGYDVCIRNAYRPYASQANIFFGRATVISMEGVDYAEAEMIARKYVAYPGTSEHQYGLSADIMDSVSTTMLAESVEDLPVLVWLKEHCAEYGFILRYPKDKQETTGWYEPWHFRYVGREAAKYIMDKEICLEEFIDRYY